MPNQHQKQLGLVGKMKRELEAGKSKKDSPDSVRKPPEPPTAGPPQEPPRASNIFEGALNSVDIVRHFQSTDSYTVDLNSRDSNFTAKQEYLDLIQDIDAESLPDFTDLDVLPGPGKGNHHPGNQEYLDLVSARVNAYKTTNINAVKTALAQEVIDSVHEQGGRFIQKEKNQANETKYTEIQITDNDVLLEKVKQAFRGRLKDLRKAES